MSQPAALPSFVYRHAFASRRDGSCDVSSSRLTEYSLLKCGLDAEEMNVGL